MTRRHRDALRERVYRAEREWRLGPVKAHAEESPELWLAHLCYLSIGFAAHDLPWLNREAVRLLAHPSLCPLHNIAQHGLAVRWMPMPWANVSSHVHDWTAHPAHIICVNPNGHRLHALDHELAHAVAVEHWDDSLPAHGPEWCAVRVHIARLRLGNALASPLRAAFEAFCGPLEAWPIATPA